MAKYTSAFLREEKNALDMGGLDPDEINVGRRLRGLRGERGLTIRALAEVSGLNVNTLSLIENERTSPSVNTIQQLARALEVPITAFFETSSAKRDIVFQKAGRRPAATFSYGSLEDLASGLASEHAQPFVVTLKPKAESGSSPIVHTGQELIYCLEGQVTYIIEDQSFDLEPGDSLVFQAYLPHRWLNPGRVPSRALLILCPLDERDRPTERHFTTG
ncbi:MAG: helix-turn-helix transcriptional regulator [Anaerolineales bacterium]|nr:helix-turn-helix transcriptional regulator [Anaerolineales bacterium]